MAEDDEKTPLLANPETGSPPIYHRKASRTLSCSLTASVKATSVTSALDPEPSDTPEVGLQRHIGLGTACAIIIGGVTGCGIFISPTGVTQNVGSVGLTLIIWTGSGLFNLILAMCYSELGTAIPVSGGDYTYIHRILGPMPSFLTLWITIILLAPGATAAMAKTVAIHIIQMLGLQCRSDLIAMLSVWIIGRRLSPPL